MLARGALAARAQADDPDARARPHQPQLLRHAAHVSLVPAAQAATRAPARALAREAVGLLQLLPQNHVGIALAVLSGRLSSPPDLGQLLTNLSSLSVRGWPAASPVV